MTFHGFPYAIWQFVVFYQNFCEGTLMMVWAGGGVLVKALRYWSDGPGIDSRWCHWIFE
jgi:hypothetical protein